VRMDILSVSEAARYLGLSRSRVEALLLQGRIPARKISAGWVINRTDLERFKAKPRLNGRPPS
jgi:excisionase family DNA binding protein